MLSAACCALVVVTIKRRVSAETALRVARELERYFAQIDLRLRVEFLTSVLYFLCHTISAKENG